MVTFSYGVVLTPGQWTSLFAGKQNALGYVPVNRAGDTMQGPLVTTPSKSTGAGFSIPPGVPPEEPVDGQVWMTIAGLFAQIGGSTVGPIANGNVVGPAVSVVGDIAIYSTTDGRVVVDSGISLASQSPNLILATPAFGSGTPSFRALVGADLPAPQSVALGGVRSAAAPSHQFGTGVDTSGNPTFAQPGIGDVSGLATNMTAFLVGGTSAQLAAAVSDETGSGPLVFATNPTVSLGTASTAVTQMPADNSNKVATTAYVQAAIFATTTLPASKFATAAALPTVTYANGASGVGATLTATANGALTIDSVAVSAGDVILVKNQASTFQNGIYNVTATGSAGAPFVLTRATYYNLAADIDLGDQTFITGGATFGATTWAQNGTENPVIGTSPITFAQTAGLGTNTAGNGLLLAGTQFSIDTSITVDKATAQTLTNKTLVTPTLTLKQSATPAPTGSGDTQFGTTNKVIAVGDGATTQIFAPIPAGAASGAMEYYTGAQTKAVLPKSTDGLFLKLAGGLPSWGATRTQGTPVAATAGAFIDFTGIPSWATEVKVMFSGVSTTGTSPVIIQAGSTSGGVEATGYGGAVAAMGGAPAVASTSTGMRVSPINASAGDLLIGALTLSLIDASTNTWAMTWLGGVSNSAFASYGACAKALTSTLDRVRITTVAGTDTFDAGKINIAYN
ncbi:hypothetical protein LB531_21280 [Mesorhizobium sp. CO1-1-2]|uniref:hypothetical protein n=1 Tax=Mesorhizobium sp. CO1-1-2 TaxID=2876635 RepID=UPI001CCABE76|nr:hypothetical protein [Mesorhizobium sp. CO1-1-2]MBZ9683193.1 hypothetical protein [Mesorhizobium sp. CO1-1-2]